jgi:glycosyltransferase involved in cell wall biosynthesis
MVNILFVHQSSEMYGSDKTLLVLLQNIDKTKYSCTVVLPNDGPLKAALEHEKIKVVIAPVLKLHRKMFAPKNIYLLVKEVWLGFKTLNLLHKQIKFDLIYSNTLAVLLGICFARLFKIKHLWHVHEIIESPKLFTVAFLFFIQLKVNSLIIYNSAATKNFWITAKKETTKNVIVLNGLDANFDVLSENKIQNIRKIVFKSNNESDIIIALVGRISRWKGQLILLKAFNQIVKIRSNVKLIFVGSAPLNQNALLQDLQLKIKNGGLEHQVVIVPFYDKIFDLWQSVDIAVVPSTEPEPFGLVAVEAMLAGKPVVASNHGGLSEIILNNDTGFLITPNNEIALQTAIQNLIDNPNLRKKMGESGRTRALSNFSIKSYVCQIEACIETVLALK